MFKAYLINANRKKRFNMLKNNKVGAMKSGSQSDINQMSQSRGQNVQKFILPPFSLTLNFFLDCVNRENSQIGTNYTVPVNPSSVLEIRPAVEV